MRPGWASALIAFPVALFLLSFVLVVYGLRGDAAEIGTAPLWVPASLMVASAYAVLVLALIQRAPESTVSWTWWVALPLAAIVFQVGSAYWTLAHSGIPPSMRWQAEAMCFWRISILGLPPVILVLALLSRGLPLRPKVAGLWNPLILRDSETGTKNSHRDTARRSRNQIGGRLRRERSAVSIQRSAPDSNLRMREASIRLTSVVRSASS